MKAKYSIEKYHLSIEQLQKFFGNEDKNLKLIEKKLNVTIIGSNEELIIEGKDILKVSTILDELIYKIINKEKIDELEVNQIISRNINDEKKIEENVKFTTTYNGKIIKPQNYSQYKYYKLLESKTIIFAMGAAGSGKTYLAIAYAANNLKSKKINKIIISRPIVEAGENLGFLPGEIKEKVDPYLTPIYDALNDMLGYETTQKYLEKQIIEIAPLAYMRGRTLNDAIVVLDEAQNTTSLQMKMFLTRLGYNTKMIITGDESQIDLKDITKSGIIHASNILKDIEEIGIIKFSSADVVRNPLVSKIINAYENDKTNSNNK